MTRTVTNLVRTSAENRSEAEHGENLFASGAVYGAECHDQQIQAKTENRDDEWSHGQGV